MKVNNKKCGITGLLYRNAQTGMVSNVLSTDDIAMLRTQLAHVKLDGKTAPFHHPHTEPYTYLGVKITPTLNRGPEMEHVISKVQDKGERCLQSALSSRQKVHFIQTSLKPTAVYTFPLSYMTPNDLAKLDRIYSRYCNKAMALPLSTPTAMIYQDIAKAGVGLTSLEVEFTKLAAEHLVKALNHKGSMGFITASLLQLQDSIVSTVMRSRQGKQELKQVTQYHLAKQLALLGKAGLKLTFPERVKGQCGNELCEQLSRITYEANDVSGAGDIPWRIYLPLLELGYNSFADLLTNRQIATLIDTLTLVRIHGSRVKNRHRLALNRLTLLANAAGNVKYAMSHAGLSPLSLNERIINSTSFSELCTTGQGQPALKALHKQEINALDLMKAAAKKKAERPIENNVNGSTQNVRCTA